MKHSLLILSFACAGALASFAESPANASSTLYDNLETSVAETFGFTVSDGKSTFDKGFVTSGESADVVYAGDKMEVDSDAANPVRFETTNDNAQDIVTLEFVLDTAIIPPSVPLATPSDGAKVGFAVCNTNSSDNYYAYTGSDWVKLSGTPKAEGESFTLKIEVDGRTGFNKARFSVRGDNEQSFEKLKNENDDEWIGCFALAKNAPIKVDFVGSGKVASLTGKRLDITAEVIVIGDDVVKVEEEDMKAFEKTAPEGTTAAVFLATAAELAYPDADGFKDKGLKVDQAYALGLLVKNDSTGKMVPVNEGKVNEGKLEIKATSAKVENDKIAIGFVDVTPRTDTGATFNYQLKGRKTGDTEWTDIGSALENEMPSIPVSAVGTYDFFKVVTTVTFPQK